MSKLERLPPVQIGVLSRPCSYCHSTWGYVDTTAPASIDPHRLDHRRTQTIMILCGMCGRELE